jgi:DNA topoisomerase-1
MKLVIVESPAKCGKIQSFLGAGYKVQATMGHIRALEESLDSVGIDRDWEPSYEELATKKDAIIKLRQAAKGAEVILATDDDREGEGIAWHVAILLKLNPTTTPRIVFHEITKTAIVEAVNNPRRLDMNKVNAQQARAMLDLLVGFTISRVLWNRVAPKLSAGRCQTPALRLVVERDLQVDTHKPEASWRLSGQWQHPENKTQTLQAEANQEFTKQEEASKALQATHNNTETTIVAVKESISISQPPKPLITSTLQQEASSLHGINPKITMMAAQKLYEAGLITYMRTDNPFLSKEAAEMTRKHVETTWGVDYLGPLSEGSDPPKGGPPGQHVMAEASKETPVATAKKSKKPDADKAEKAEPQAAHEAIRPTHPEDQHPAIADDTQQTIYALIWKRATQSQMSAAQAHVRKTTLALKADPTRQWTAEQTKLKFLGWKVLEKQDPEKQKAEEQAWLVWTSKLVQGAILHWSVLKADEVFTKPKGRYTEASLIADLEKKGIGRPSTFASLVTTIIDRGYTEKTNTDGKLQKTHHLQIKPNQWPPAETTQDHKVGAEKNKLQATALGRSVSDFLAKEYSDLFNYDFTAAMEQSLDAVAKAEKPWKSVLQTTWDTYKDRYKEMTTMTGGKAAREKELGPNVKVILSRKGPLFVKEPATDGEKATFAPLPNSVTFETATLADAEAAFITAVETAKGELIGMLETQEIRKKKGPYGLYIECGQTRIPYKGETLEQIQEKLQAKITFAQTETAFERKVGDYTIRKGPYGLYLYKHALVKKQFAKFTKTEAEAKTITATELATMYSAGLAAKRKKPFVKKDKA